jgi:N-methylhydantoinase B/oxoprolinase/acetone carboxylase alpha subunit
VNPAEPGSFLINGRALLEAKKREMQPDDEVLMETPGGGGFGAPDASSPR